ncbi:MAG TPA: rhomboid family intramembrane serine protease [Thermoleophilaceae bacterium]|nr:rhomboid family intramembrane serine protease [Thermoleophilaceae bacterium]
MSQPDLFVVCKNCGSEVSPYVTECPYCGQRVRKRAPKIDRSSGEPQTKRRRRAKKLPRLRAEEIAGIAPDTRPYATFGLIAACVVAMLLYAADQGLDLGYVTIVDNAPGLSDDDVWRWFLAPFLHADQLGYGFVALVPVGIFGTLLERRFGAVSVVATFILAGAAGTALAVVLETPPLLSDTPVWNVIGANGAALGLLVAWLVDDRLAARRGEDRENDLLGVYVIAVVLVLLSLTTEEANIAAAVGGALTGALLGLLLPRLTRTP